MLFKSDTMNALVACGLLDEGYDLHETLERMDSFSFLLQEGRSGELYDLVLWEGNRIDEGKKSRQTLRDKSNRAGREKREAQAGQRSAEAGEAEAKSSRSRLEGETISQTQKAKEAGPKGYAAGREQGAGETADERDRGDAESARADKAESQSAGKEYLAAKAAKKDAGQKAGVEIGKARSERDAAKGEASDEKQHGDAEQERGRELEKTARGSDARKKTAERIRGMRKTISGMKDKAKEKGEGEQGEQGEQGEKGQGDGKGFRGTFKGRGDDDGGDGGRDDRTTREKIKDTGDHLEHEDLEHDKGRSGRRGGGFSGTFKGRGDGGGGRSPDIGAADKDDTPSDDTPSDDGGKEGEHRRGEEKAEGEHRRGMEKTEHERKQKGKGKWGDTLRKGLEGAGSLIKKGVEGTGKLIGGAARGLGRGIERMDKKRTARYGAQTTDRTKEGEHKRGMERDAQSQKHERGMKGAREGETSAERTAKTAQTQRSKRAETGRAKAETPDQIRSRSAADTAKAGTKTDSMSNLRASVKAKRNQRLSRAARGVRSSYSPQENSPELGIMSEHLKVDQSGENDHWQNLMAEVVSNKRNSLLNEAKKKSLRKRGS